jgi:hypothetical protein
MTTAAATVAAVAPTISAPSPPQNTEQEFVTAVAALGDARTRLHLSPYGARVERRTFTSHVFLSTRTPAPASLAAAHAFPHKLPSAYKTLYFEITPPAPVADSFPTWRPYARTVSQISLDYRRSKSKDGTLRPVLLWLEHSLLRQATSSLLPAHEITWALCHKDAPMTISLYYDTTFNDMPEKDVMLEFRCGRYASEESLLKDFVFDKSGRIERVASYSLLFDMFYSDIAHEACTLTKPVVEKEAHALADLMINKRRASRVHMTTPLGGWLVLTDGADDACDVELNFTVTVTDLVMVDPAATRK